MENARSKQITKNQITHAPTELQDSRLAFPRSRLDRADEFQEPRLGILTFKAAASSLGKRLVIAKGADRSCPWTDVLRARQLPSGGPASGRHPPRGVAVLR